MSEHYQANLAGKSVPLHDGAPQVGFYKMRKARGGPWLPVAIWNRDGTLVCRVAKEMADPITMGKRRDHIPLKPRLAAALCNMLRPDESGTMVPVIDHESAKQMTEDQVLSLFHFDHWPLTKANGGPDAHWNLEPRPIMEHRQKSAQIDAPQRAKTESLSAKQEEFRHRLLAKAGQGEVAPKRSRWPTRKMNWRR
jgi:hypothetical protein